MHDFYSMSIGTGFFLSTAVICGTLIFKIMCELLVDILDSVRDK